jgi:hypothetical protein
MSEQLIMWSVFGLPVAIMTCPDANRHFLLLNCTSAGLAWQHKIQR